MRLQTYTELSQKETWMSRALKLNSTMGAVSVIKQSAQRQKALPLLEHSTTSPVLYQLITLLDSLHMSVTIYPHHSLPRLFSLEGKCTF